MTHAPTTARPSWAQNLPIALRLSLALGLLLALLGGVIVLALRQSEWVGASSRQLAESGLRQVTLARQAQTEALLGAGHLHTLFLLDRQEQRIPIYTLIDRCTAVRNAALDALAAGVRDAEARKTMASVTLARQGFVDAFQDTVDMVEMDLPAARPLMVERTLPALREMLAALDAMAEFETARAHARLSDIETLQSDSRRRILELGALAVLAALVSAVLITRSVALPLRQAAQLAREIALGRMEGVLPPAGRDEVGSLVRALDHMRGSLAEREARIGELAFRDPLTGLANRTLFTERLTQATAGARRTGQALSVLLLDLDRFKDVNDVLGHDLGDQLLVKVARRLSEKFVRSSDTVARLGGDEFALLLATQGCEQAQAAAREVMKVLEEPLALGGQTVDVRGSVGIACFPQDGADAAALMARADIAMYVAKHARTGYACFAPEMERSSEHGLGLLSDLRRAIDEDQFALVFQPKLALGDGRCHSAEALLRWRHPQRGNVSPADFIPFAEHTGFIRSITQWVVRRAVRQLAQWHAQGVVISLNINVSARDLTQQDLPALVREQLAACGVPARHLCLEVTEGAIMEDPARALAALQALKDLGVRWSIDDFGTGYSSLAYLKKLPVDELKIDRSFVINLDRDEDDARIVRATIDLAHNMGLRVVAEGVESDAVLQRLWSLGCDEAQGYFIGHPLPADEFVRWMRGQTAVVAA
ncbi:MAG TPA: EAL domain-containing protein [Ideonella sp.]|jgi:diguanylate cyclase (GGDEF)-like protein|nr:EAL domain-containing protein [Ideonella sp.]